MPGKKKKFIDKKNAVTFHLVHRSQRDPLQASEDAAKHVLLPVKDKDESDRKEEQKKYGIYFEDDYDYMKHLKDTNEAYELEPVERIVIQKDPKIQLPSSLFASEVETDVGLLNHAAPLRGPQLDWDPDIVAALDEDFDYDDPGNRLDDDFMQIANADEQDREEGQEEEYGSDIASDECDMFGSDCDMGEEYGDRMFMDEETKSRFTNYSMSSSVMRRNDGLSLLDDRFEKLYEQYDDDEIGALDQDDIDGSVQQGSHILDTILEDFEKTQEMKKLKDVMDEHKTSDIEVESDDDSGTENDLVKMVVEEPKEKWDCESILSTYSNLYNHPKLIVEPKKEKKIDLTSKLGIPNDVLAKPGLTRKQIEEEMRASRKADQASTYRPKDETAEERRTRKQAVKQDRQNRRQEKKANKMAFSAEKVRQNKDIVNLKNNLQGVVIS